MNQDNTENASFLKGGRGLLRIIKSTQYSLQGLHAAFKNEAAFRQLVYLSLVLLPLAMVLDVTNTQRAILISAVLLSLAIELLNTAIENAIDRISMELHPLSKKAKDMGSAAQFIGILIIIVAWTSILG